MFLTSSHQKFILDGNQENQINLTDSIIIWISGRWGVTTKHWSVGRYILYVLLEALGECVFAKLLTWFNFVDFELICRGSICKLVLTIIFYFLRKHFLKNQKVPGSNPTRRLAGLRNLTLLQGFQWPSSWICKNASD